MDIALCGLDAVMTQHFFDLEDGSTGLQQVLGAGMPETVSGFGYACLVETSGDVMADGAMGNGPIGRRKVHKEGPVFDLRACMGHIDDNGLEGLLWQRKAQPDGVFSIGDPDFLFGKRDVLQRNEADLVTVHGESWLLFEIVRLTVIFFRKRLRSSS